MTDRTQLSTWARQLIPDSENRDKHDYYPTPPGATRALLRAEAPFNGIVWEPACGDGAMARVLEEAGCEVVASDLVDRGYGTGGVDFLLDWRTSAQHVVTNPPFQHAQAFVEHARQRVPGRVAIFARLQLLEGAKRAELLQRHLARVHVFSNRVPIAKGRLVEPGEANGRMMAYAWYVFEQAPKSAPTISWVTYRADAQAEPAE